MTLVDQIARRISDLAVPGYGSDEVRFMAETVLELRPDAIFEWGTNRGSSARIFFELTTRLRPRPPIHTIDVADELALITADHAGADTGLFVRGLSRVHCHRGDGVTVALEQHALLAPFRPLFFVDGNHDPGPVQRELFLIAEQAPRAVILAHDTNHPAAAGPTGPAEAVAKLVAAYPRYTVATLRSQAGMTRLVPL